MIVRIRSAKQRQTAVFLDGAPLATPCDGRVNLRAFRAFDGPYEDGALTLVAAVDNADDELVLQQLGLPAPSRS